MSPAVEIAVEDLAGLEVAALAGADRIELCQDLDLGGTTPAPELVEQAVRRARELVAARDATPPLDVHVLIRPRASSADFLGRPAEFAADADAIARMVAQAAAGLAPRAAIRARAAPAALAGGGRGGSRDAGARSRAGAG